MQIDIHYFRSTNSTVSDSNTRSFDWKKSFQAGAHKSLSVDQFVGRRNESTIWTWDEDAAASTSTSTEGRRPFHSGKPTFRTDQKSRGIHTDCRGGGGEGVPPGFESQTTRCTRGRTKAQISDGDKKIVSIFFHWHSIGQKFHSETVSGAY